MRNEFAMTKNVMRFLAGMEVVETPVNGRIGMLLGLGEPGTGKTEVGQWYANKHDCPYIRATDIMSRRSLLSKIVAELGVAPDFRTDDLFNQAVDFLIDHPTTIIIDEVDYLVRGGMVEVLRDLNDVTNIPIVMIGMQRVDKKLRRFPHLFDRFATVVRFQTFGLDDIKKIAEQICEVRINDNGLRFIHERGQGKFRLTMSWFAKAERLARNNCLELVTEEHLKQAKMDRGGS